MEQEYINKFLNKGKDVEKEFSKLFRNVDFAPKQQDIYEHFDLTVSYKIAVKGMKKIRRSDEDVNEFIHWIEIKGISGHVGSLYGEADYFAFESKKYWIIVEKFKLQDFIKNNVIKEYTDVPTLYKLYRRKDRKDVLTLVETIDLIYLSEAMLLKNENNKVIEITSK